MDMWILFFKRIKNSTNLYIIRESQYPVMHRLWSLYFRNEHKYFYELNIKRVLGNEISNFYYATRLNNVTTKKHHRYNLVLMYYFNKIVLNHYPYFYWTYILTYNKYNYNKKASKKSQHIRSHLFFCFIKFLNSFIKKVIASIN